MSRQIVLDTETTGFDYDKGDRIVEIGCIEMINREITDNHFHVYINPERSMPIEAFNVHGLSEEFLSDKPLFAEVGQKFLDYIDDADLIIHNAGFDVPFLNYELAQMGLPPVTDRSEVIDTLKMAREIYPGQRNTLDALCRRLGVDNSRRELHGALLDSELLAQVYLNMTGGQESFFDAFETVVHNQEAQSAKNAALLASNRQIKRRVCYANEEELTIHQAFLEKFKN